MTSDRHARHRIAAAGLAALSDDQLTELLGAGEAGGVGVGGGSVRLTVDGVPIFAKLIPMTESELARPRSTENLFRLPMYCQYGVGGPSFGAWRELEANLMVTEGVLSGAAQGFPVLYHWKVLPGRAAIADEHKDIDAVAARLGGSIEVRRRLEQLAAASHSLVLFLEYLPMPLLDWLSEEPVPKAELVERQLAEIVGFLHGRGILHMDGHFGNMLTDGHQIYLADFGLATSAHFDLSVAEQEFVQRNATHDADYAAMTLANWLVRAVDGPSLPRDAPTSARNAYIRRCAEGHLPDDLPDIAAGILTRHAAAAARMNDFYWEVFGGNVGAEYPGSLAA
ncbi:MAG: serine/threonine protein phosphatase [Hamadaea sp.]|nr:serine/threonine protein phosphatase [Hamadaea sp.]